MCHLRLSAAELNPALMGAVCVGEKLISAFFKLKEKETTHTKLSDICVATVSFGFVTGLIPFFINLLCHLLN